MRRANRAAYPFIVRDCRTTPRELVEAHLFGEAARDGGPARVWIFESANGGTLLLDEPGDLDLDAQTKLLRAIDKGMITRVGDHTPVHIDARIAVATTQNLDKLVEEGRFREDLYYRLAGARIRAAAAAPPPRGHPLPRAELWTELGGKSSSRTSSSSASRATTGPATFASSNAASSASSPSAIGSRSSSTAHTAHVARPDLPAGKAGAGDDVLSRVLGANLGYSEARQRMLDEFERAYLEKALADNKGNVAGRGRGRRHRAKVLPADPRASALMVSKADEILAVLDRCCDAFTFPMLDNGYVYLAATRLSLHRSEQDWALVIEVFGHSVKAGIPDLCVYCFGSRPHNRERPEAGYHGGGSLEGHLANHPHDESYFLPSDRARRLAWRRSRRRAELLGNRGSRPRDSTTDARRFRRVRYRADGAARRSRLRDEPVPSRDPAR